MPSRPASVDRRAALASTGPRRAGTASGAGRRRPTAQPAKPAEKP